MVAFEFPATVPLSIITSVFASGSFPQLRFEGFSQAELPLPIQLFEKTIVNKVLLSPLATRLNLYPYHEEGILISILKNTLLH
jgi:hypothetical protein